MSRQEMRLSKLRERRSSWCPRPAPLDQRPMIRDPIRMPLESISFITFIKFIILTQEHHESPKSRSMGFSTGLMTLVDIQMSDHASLTPGFTFAVEPYDQCHLRKDSAGQMKLMLVPCWSLREVQNELVVIPGHLSLATPLTNTGLCIADRDTYHNGTWWRPDARMGRPGTRGGNSRDCPPLLAPARTHATPLPTSTQCHQSSQHLYDRTYQRQVQKRRPWPAPAAQNLSDATKGKVLYHSRAGTGTEPGGPRGGDRWPPDSG